MTGFEIRILRCVRPVKRREGPYSDRVLVDVIQFRARDTLTGCWGEWTDAPVVDEDA